MSGMYAESYQKIYEDLAHHDVSVEMTVKKFYNAVGAVYSSNQEMGFLRAFAQLKYIEFKPEVKDLYNINPSDTFFLTAVGMTAWKKWFAENPYPSPDKPPKEDFI